MGLARCSSCGAAMRWVPTDKGGRMPLDAEPVPDGNVVIVDQKQPRFTRRVAHVLAKDEEPPADAKRYVSHFATCDDPKRFRRSS